MWELTVERRYQSGINGSTYETTDRVYFESEELSSLEIIVNWFKRNAVEGKYKYFIKHIEEEGEEDA